ncbi:MAG: hypothetical protein WA790_17645 [Sulfitobacter sp.]
MQIVDIKHSMDRAQFPDLDALQTRYGWDQRNHKIFDRLFHLKSTSLHDNMTLHEALEYSAQQLVDANPELSGNVDLIVYCHAVNDVMPFSTTALEDIAHSVFDSDGAETMSITMGSCSSAIMAMQWVAGMGDAYENVVVLTGEKCFFRLLDYAENNGLFGETTSATYLRPNSKQGLQVDVTRSGAFKDVYELLGLASKEVLADYDRAFIPTMTDLVTNTLSDAGLSPDDVNVVLPTHLSPFTFNRISTIVGIGGGRVLKQNLDKIGHCYCGDLFINTSTWLSGAAQSDQPQRVLSFAAGMTGSYAAVIISKDT